MRNIILLTLCLLSWQSPIMAEDSAGDGNQAIELLLQKYCVDCHNDKKSQGELNLAKIIAESESVTHRKLWQSMRNRVIGREMPPDDAPQPTADERERMAHWCATNITKIDAATPPQPGRVTMRRLNRVEYRNTIRDLLGVEFDLAWDPTRDFPGDGAGYGFDNIGDVLSVSPLHLEQYLTAASSILQRAVIVDGLQGPHSWKFSANELQMVSPTRPTSGTGMWPTHWIAEIPVLQSGEYHVQAVIRCEVDNGLQAQMAIQTDGREPERFTFTRKKNTQTVERKIKVVEPGTRQIGVAYLHEQNKKLFEPTDAENGLLFVDSITVSGPFIDLQSIPESHRRLFVAQPSETLSRREAAQQILAKFLPRAFRRPVNEKEVEQYVRLFEKANQSGVSFEYAMLSPLRAALVSPHFLFRVEQDHSSNQESYQLDAFALASRLSYFLWSSMPDEELFRVAKDSTLLHPQVLEQQTKRMLADPQFSALAESFVTQWLQIRTLDTFQPASKTGKLGTRLRQGMQAEPVQLFQEAVAKNLSLTTLIDAPFTYANQELAKHYKLPLLNEHSEKSPQKERDRVLRYELSDTSIRGGIITTAAVLTATSLPDRTSPVKRGKWVLDALLGAPPPPPPPLVEALKDEPNAQQKVSLRQRLELHRSAAACANCHKRMDPLGFAFEHYDALGRWREKDGNQAIDTSAILPDGKTIDGIPGLKSYLLAEKEAFARCLSEKLLTYAVGRGLEPFDARAIDEIVQATAKDEYRMQRLILEIVNSYPFRYRSTAIRRQ